MTVSFHSKIFSDYLNLYIIINYFLYVYYLLPFRVNYNNDSDSGNSGNAKDTRSEQENNNSTFNNQDNQVGNNDANNSQDTVDTQSQQLDTNISSTQILSLSSLWQKTTDWKN